MNHPSLSNGSSKNSSSKDKVLSGEEIKQEELVRLMLQTLQDFGYSKAVQTLESESGIAFQNKSAMELCESIINGKWDKLDKTISSLHLEKQTEKKTRFLVFQQKFLELLESKQTKLALECLRNEISPLGHDIKEVHKLSSLMLCPNVEELYKKANWDGMKGHSREKVVSSLRGVLPPSLLLPEKRLQNLLHQSLHHQKKKCLYHNTLDESISLLAEHKCERTQVPTESVAVLEKHSNEVWFVKYSNNGLYLASSSKDGGIILWDMKLEVPKALKTLTGHGSAVSLVSWSPDDSLLLSVSIDNSLKLWKVETGECLKTLTKHTEPIVSCAWFPDGKKFASGGLDKTIFIMDLEGQELKTISTSRVNDMVISNDGQTLVVICQEKKLRFYDLESMSETYIQQSDAITSLEKSSDGKYLLVNVCSNEIHLWDLKTKSLKQRYRAHKQTRFVIRSCFFGAKNAFVASGSEDSQVYIWHRKSGKLLFVLEGHSGTVNAVAGSPHDITRFVSCSDDRTIRVWQSPDSIVKKT